MALFIVMFIIYTLATFAAGVFCVYFKNSNTYKNRYLIDNAICDYQRDMRNDGIFKVKVKCSDMESYEATLWRWWDWGYKNILPKDKYTIIKPYIRKR